VIFLFSITSRSILRPTQPPIQLVPRFYPLGVNWQEREADYSSPFSAENKNGGSIPSLPIWLHGIVLSCIIKDTPFTHKVWCLVSCYAVIVPLEHRTGRVNTLLAGVCSHLSGDMYTQARHTQDVNPSFASYVGVVIRDEVSRGWRPGVTGALTTVAPRHSRTGSTTWAVQPRTMNHQHPKVKTNAKTIFTLVK
jgi:hypothetical protein